MKLKIRKLSPKAIIPNYAHAGDAGLDLYSIESTTLLQGEIKLVKTGIALELPVNTEAQIRPRSGLALKNGVTVLNTPGTIDEGYRGEIGIILINHGKEKFEINEGAKIAQMVIKPVIKVDIEEVDKLDTTDRGEGGFGSTGV